MVIHFLRRLFSKFYDIVICYTKKESTRSSKTECSLFRPFRKRKPKRKKKTLLFKNRNFNIRIFCTLVVGANLKSTRDKHVTGKLQNLPYN